MIPLGIFRNRVFALGNVSLLLSFVTAYTVVFLMPFYLTMVLGLPISEVGLILAAFPLVMLVVSPISGTISDRIGSRVLTCTGMIICCVAMILLSSLTAQNSVREIIGYLLLFSLGISIFQSPNSSSVMGSIPPMHLGIASGILANMRNLGMVLGIAISGAIFYNIAPVALGRDYSGFNRGEIQLILNGFHWAYLTAAGISFIAFITSFFSKRSVKA
jgi:MFS family permease